MSVWGGGGNCRSRAGREKSARFTAGGGRLMPSNALLAASNVMQRVAQHMAHALPWHVSDLRGCLPADIYSCRWKHTSQSSNQFAQVHKCAKKHWGRDHLLAAQFPCSGGSFFLPPPTVRVEECAMPVPVLHTDNKILQLTVLSQTAICRCSQTLPNPARYRASILHC